MLHKAFRVDTETTSVDTMGVGDVKIVYIEHKPTGLTYRSRDVPQDESQDETLAALEQEGIRIIQSQLDEIRELVEHEGRSLDDYFLQDDLPCFINERGELMADVIEIDELAVALRNILRWKSETEGSCFNMSPAGPCRLPLPPQVSALIDAEPLSQYRNALLHDARSCWRLELFGGKTGVAQSDTWEYYPQATWPDEVCDNASDDDSDGLSDCADPDCDGKSCGSGQICESGSCI